MIKLLYFLGALVIWGDMRLHPLTLTDKECLPVRGLSVLLIIIGHIVSYAKIITYDVLNVGYYCVRVFFFLSGYGCAQGLQHKEGYLRFFWRKRFSSVLIPFLTVHIFYLVVKGVCGTDFSIKDVVIGLIGGCTVVDYSWFPIALILMYGCFWTCSRFFYHKPLMFKSSIILSVLMLTIAEYFILGIKRDWWFISNASFALGVLISQKGFTAWRK